MEESKAGFHFPEQEKRRTIFIVGNGAAGQIGDMVASSYSNDFRVVIAQEEVNERERLKNKKFEILLTEKMVTTQIYEHYPFTRKRKKPLKGRFAEQFLNKVK
jgi:hypothetical protein